MSLFDVRAVLLAGVIFIPLERLVPLHGEQRALRSRWDTDVIYVFANGALIRIGLAAVMVVTSALSAWLVPAGLRVAVARQPYWVQVIEALILADLGFYIAHRMFHRVPWLWRFHAIHHSIEELDWLAGVRVHALDQVVTKGMSMVPLLVLGFDGVPIGISAVIYFWHSILLHANVRMTFGPLRWVVASPVFHHWHHAARPEAYGKNFAGQLSILDKLFGTMYLPEGQAPQRYGVADPVPPTYISQMLYPFNGTRSLK
jgi:sterol desaturase/sphingolipid hydroxylase (fatty acid hydroxylase superfamily)